MKGYEWWVQGVFEIFEGDTKRQFCTKSDKQCDVAIYIYLVVVTIYDNLTVVIDSLGGDIYMCIQWTSS